MDPIHALCLVIILTAFLCAGGYFLYNSGFDHGAKHALSCINAMEQGKVLGRLEAKAAAEGKDLPQVRFGHGEADEEA